MKKILVRDLTFLIHPYQKVVIIPDNSVSSDYIARAWINCKTDEREVTDIYPHSVKGEDYLMIRVK